MNKAYIIKDIKNKETNLTRTDGRYPQRIGSTIYFDLFDPVIGKVAFLTYITDNEGKPREGTLRTSTVQDIQEEDNKITLYTRNSIFELEEVDNYDV